jgi:hypothetical protein
MGQTRERDCVQLETPLKKWTPLWLHHQILTVGVLKYNFRICWKFQANNYYKKSASRILVSNMTKTQTWWCWLLYSRPSSRDPCYALGVKQKQDWDLSLQSPFLTLNFTAKTILLVTTFPSTERLDTVTKPIFFSLSLFFLIQLSILILFVKSFFQSERSPSYMQRWWNPWCHECV